MDEVRAYGIISKAIFEQNFLSSLYEVLGELSAAKEHLSFVEASDRVFEIRSILLSAYENLYRAAEIMEANQIKEVEEKFAYAFLREQQTERGTK